MSCLTKERVRELLEYNPITGLFTNRAPRGNLSVGAPTGISLLNGYLRIAIDGKRYQAHRIAWLYMTGEMPKDEIDHVNGDKSDNRWENLREATRLQNSFNKGPCKNNLLGIKGIRKTREGTYQVRVGQKSYGCYRDLELAEFISQEVRTSLHGEFARYG